ncbi:hypothetical protein BUALT_Bualt01G0003900 [Buddleja alternifolia]|uniref:Uncharacterized protein n=1 Tax=Buddleja alternifolia TaxID=168488 RepID=A0AAV6Y4I4_9LAMI|nr:hypothetical protein BUALT_Bualt01G0003900 [Buddleja alternifolia]
MASSPSTHNNSYTQILLNEEETPYSTPILFWPVARRTSSYSSSSPENSWDSSSTFSCNDEYNTFPPPFSPITPLKFKGIPFSWEEIPGMPKNQCFKKKESGRHLLPLPPARNTNSSTKKLHNYNQKVICPKKYDTSNTFQKDPFFAALVECSKDDNHDDHGANFGNILKGSSNKITRVLSDRFGFMNMSTTSCKSTCAVSESIVYLPRPRPHYLLNRRN